MQSLSVKGWLRVHASESDLEPEACYRQSVKATPAHANAALTT